MKLRRSHFKKLQRRRYDARAYRNPYLHKRPARSFLRRILLPATIVLVIGLILYVLASPAMRIHTIAIEGAQSIAKEDLSSQVRQFLDTRRFLFFRQSNRWLLSNDGLRHLLSARYALDDLHIKQRRGVLTVSFTEKISYLLWKTGEDVYVADLQGTIIRQNTDEESALPLFVDRNAIPVRIRSVVLTPEEAGNIFRFHEHLLRQSIAIKETQIDRLAGKWMSVVTMDGYRILFDATGDIDLQARNLEVLLRDTIDDPRGLEYIDLRFGDHVYYK